MSEHERYEQKVLGQKRTFGKVLEIGDLLRVERHWQHQIEIYRVTEFTNTRAIAQQLKDDDTLDPESTIAVSLLSGKIRNEDEHADLLEEPLDKVRARNASWLQWEIKRAEEAKAEQAAHQKKKDVIRYQVQALEIHMDMISQSPLVYSLVFQFPGLRQAVMLCQVKGTRDFVNGEYVHHYQALAIGFLEREARDNYDIITSPWASRALTINEALRNCILEIAWEQANV